MYIDAETITFDNVDDVATFVRYNPKNAKSVSDGYFLAEDIVNNEGGVLYANNSELDAMKIGRLKKLIENNPETNPKVVLKLNVKLVKVEREKIKTACKALIDSKKTRMEYTKMMGLVQTMLDSKWDDFLKNQEIVLLISRLKFLEDKSKKSNINPYYNHILNTLIFSIGIMMNMLYVNQEKFKSQDYTDVGLLALLSNTGGWETSGQYIEKPIEERNQKFIEDNEKNATSLKRYNIGDTLEKGLAFCHQFQAGDLGFLKEESRSSKFAQIVSVARKFDEFISGLWGVMKTPREVTDLLYVKATTEEFPRLYVDALAKGLKFDNLFDFYHELDLLIRSCARNKSAPYPMKGFKSPVIFVCKDNLIECKEYIASAKAITIFKDAGGLPEGSYGRCEGLSDRLTNFYEEHYSEIKEDVIAKQTGTGRFAVEGDQKEAAEVSKKADKGAKAVSGDPSGTSANETPPAETKKA